MSRIGCCILWPAMFGDCVLASRGLSVLNKQGYEIYCACPGNDRAYIRDIFLLNKSIKETYPVELGIPPISHPWAAGKIINNQKPLALEWLVSKEITKYISDFSTGFDRLDTIIPVVHMELSKLARDVDIEPLSVDSSVPYPKGNYMVWHARTKEWSKDYDKYNDTFEGSPNHNSDEGWEPERHVNKATYFRIAEYCKEEYNLDAYQIDDPLISIPEQVALLKHCKFFLGCESGPQHLAGFCGVPVIQANLTHPWPSTISINNHTLSLYKHVSVNGKILNVHAGPKFGGHRLYDDPARNMFVIDNTEDELRSAVDRMMNLLARNELPQNIEIIDTEVN